MLIPSQILVNDKPRYLIESSPSMFSWSMTSLIPWQVCKVGIQVVFNILKAICMTTWQCSKRSLTYIRKRRGPSMLPWGTPTGTFCWVDWQFSTDVTWYRISRYEANHFTTWELAPMVLSFSTRSAWPTVSKAFETSKKTAPVKPPLSRLCTMLSVKWARAVTVESLGRKLA